MKTENTYKITGQHASRIASRDGVTLHTDTDGSYCIVRPVGWIGGDAEGRNVLDYFRGSLGGLALSASTYLGPDDDGVEPTWEDAR